MRIVQGKMKEKKLHQEEKEDVGKVLDQQGEEEEGRVKVQEMSK